MEDSKVCLEIHNTPKLVLKITLLALGHYDALASIIDDIRVNFIFIPVKGHSQGNYLIRVQFTTSIIYSYLMHFT